MPSSLKGMRRAAALVPLFCVGGAYGQSQAQVPATALPEVTVRAQLVDEKATDVPISLRVFGPEELRRGYFDRTEDVLRATPGVTFTNEGATAFSGRVYIRGVGSAVRWVDQSVGFYVDDVFVGSNVAINAALLDLDRIEVLRGPQGTLYGRSATGGAVNVSTSAPTATHAGPRSKARPRPRRPKAPAATPGTAGAGGMEAHTYTYMYTHIYIYMYVYIYIPVYI